MNNYQELQDKLDAATDHYDRWAVAGNHADRTRGALVYALAYSGMDSEQIMQLIDDHEHALASVARHNLGYEEGREVVADVLEPRSYKEWLKRKNPAEPVESVLPVEVAESPEPPGAGAPALPA